MIDRKYSIAVFLSVLAGLVLAVYWQTTGFELISLDDASYTLKNPAVREGLTIKGLKTVLTQFMELYWIPVTWLSYMADVSISGLSPEAFHRTNVILFCANVILLFLFLRSATGSNWKSFFVAALWAMHPLRVESVAWVTERKDVLSGLFFILALWSHLFYVRTGKLGYYAGVGVFGALGLLSKPIVVVLPVALLLIDFWPLGRFTEGLEEANYKEKLRRIKGLVLEKTPVIVLSLASVAITLYSQLLDNPDRPVRSLFHGFSNSVTSYWKYLGRTFLPNDLLLSFDTQISSYGTFTVLVSLAALAAVSVLAFKLRRRVPEVTFGWFWFLLLLLPNSGIVPAGLQPFADRFTYLPHIGLAVALVWGASRLAEKSEAARKTMVLTGTAAIIALTIASHTFTGYWKNSYTLFGHIDEIYGGKNPLALNGLATAYMYDDDPARALDYLDRLIESDFSSNSVRQNRIIALYKLGRYDEAVGILSEELKADPQNLDLINLMSRVTRAKAQKR